MWVSRPLAHALHWITLLRGKTFSRRLNQAKFSHWLRGAYWGTLSFVPLALRRHFSSADTPRNACTFLSEKSPLGFCGAFFYRLSREEFSAARPSRLFFFSARALIWRGGAGARGVVAGLKWALEKSGARNNNNNYNNNIINNNNNNNNIDINNNDNNNNNNNDYDNNNNNDNNNDNHNDNNNNNNNNDNFENNNTNNSKNNNKNDNDNNNVGEFLR
jgi:hypothetical protein